jgi:hypothetical protein
MIRHTKNLLSTIIAIAVMIACVISCVIIGGGFAAHIAAVAVFAFLAWLYLELVFAGNASNNPRILKTLRYWVTVSSSLITFTAALLLADAFGLFEYVADRSENRERGALAGLVMILGGWVMQSRALGIGRKDPQNESHDPFVGYVVMAMGLGVVITKLVAIPDLNLDMANAILTIGSLLILHHGFRHMLYGRSEHNLP